MDKPAISNRWNPETILALRTRLGLSQRAFAELLGTIERTVLRWECRTGNPVNPIPFYQEKMDQLDDEVRNA